MIPLPKDTRDVIGDFAEKVENRSLLFEKMVLPKSWGHDVKFDEANRFNVLRASSGGPELLREQKDEADRKVRSERTKPEVKEQNRYKSRVAAALSQCSVGSEVLSETRIRSTLNLLHKLESAYPGKVETFVGSLGGKLLINLAGGVQENAGLSLDRCFGLPYIPGSSVKGIARHTALWDIRLEKDPSCRLRKLAHALAIFGYTSNDIKPSSQANFVWAVEGDIELLESALQKLPPSDSVKGTLSFLPAYPSSSERLTIVAEGLTPHTDPKTGKDTSPKVLTFPAVERGSQFGFAILANRKLENLESSDLLASASAWVRDGITDHGIGAKTSSGYGWFTIDPDDEIDRRQRQAHQVEAESRERNAIKKRTEEKMAAAEAEAAESIRFAGLSEEDQLVETIARLDDSGFIEKAKTVSELPHSEQIAFFKVLTSSQKKDRRKQWKKKKPELWSTLRDAAEKIGSNFPA